jgi:CHAT domain-containing protein
MGDAPTSGTQFPRLEYASREIDSIARSVGGTRQAILRGEDARPAAYSNAQPGQFGFIHFAAHATANAQSPLDSAVVLSGPPDGNRLLARSVMGIPLAAELVTISACRSAGGKAYAGEGLVGFAWAFLRAGARNVVAGLWDVSDRSTAELMSGLYANVAAGEDVPTALRAAKLELIHKGGAYEKPFYWAPFQLYVGAIR